MPFLVAWAAGVVLALPAPTAGGPVTIRSAPRVVPARGQPLGPPAPPVEGRPAATVTLLLDAPTTYGPWTMRVTNVGDVPLRLVADARLLGLEVTPRGARKGVRCALPDDMRPSGDDERAIVLPPKRSYVERFEPRLHCFGEGLHALGPGAIVIGRMGWERGKGAPGKTKPPFVVSPLEEAQREAVSLSSIESLPIAVPDEATPAALPSMMRPTLGPDVAPRLTLRGAATVDAATPNEIAIPVILRNEGARRVVIRFRPEALGFDVVGPAGVEHCVWPGMPAAAMRELFTPLSTNETASLTVLLNAYCRGHALDEPGLAVVRPWLDTRGASGEVIGLHTFDGQVIATTPTLVRLHRGATAIARARPLLEPARGAPPP